VLKPNLMNDAVASLSLRAARREPMLVPSMLDMKGTKILAKSLFKELRANGYSPNQILGLTTELIELVTQDLREANAAAQATEPLAEVRASA